MQHNRQPPMYAVPMGSSSVTKSPPVSVTPQKQQQTKGSYYCHDCETYHDYPPPPPKQSPEKPGPTPSSPSPAPQQSHEYKRATQTTTTTTTATTTTTTRNSRVRLSTQSHSSASRPPSPSATVVPDEAKVTVEPPAKVKEPDIQGNRGDQCIVPDTISSGDYSMRRTIPVPSDGDCLFHCIAMVMKDLGKDVHARQLRYHVAQTMFQDDPRVNSVIQKWVELYTAIAAIQPPDRELLREYLHVREVAEKYGHEPLCQEARESIYRHMMHRGIFYGEEYSIDVLRDVLDLDILVLSPKEVGRSLNALLKRHVKHKNFFCFLVLVGGNHYELLEIDDNIVWASK